MKGRRILATALTALTIFAFSGCAEKDENGYEIATSFDCCGTFILIEENGNYHILVHKETRVMYLCDGGIYGGITVLVDENGNPLLWKGDLS